MQSPELITQKEHADAALRSGDNIFTPPEKGMPVLKPSVTVPGTLDFRRLPLPLDDSTLIPSDDLSVQINEGVRSFKTLTILIGHRILGGDLRSDETIKKGRTSTVLTWEYPEMELGSAMRSIVEANEMVSPEHRVSVPYPQNFPGYTEEGEERDFTSDLCAGAFALISLATGVNEHTGSEHPLRPIQTNSTEHVRHDFYDHFLVVGEMLHTPEDRERFRQIYLGDARLHKPQREIFGRRRFDARHHPRIISFSELLDNKSFEMHNHPDNEESARNYDRSLAVVRRHGVSLSDIPIAA